MAAGDVAIDRGAVAKLRHDKGRAQADNCRVERRAPLSACFEAMVVRNRANEICVL